MSQAPVILPGSPLTGAAAAGDMNAAWAAMISQFSGNSAPPSGPGASGALVEGQYWLNTTPAGTISAPHVLNRWNGTIWVPQSVKTLLTADTTYFFDSSLGNDANSGLSSGAGAFKTFAVVNSLVNSIDTNGHQLILSLAAGQAWSNFSLTVPVIGGGTVVLDGNNGATTTMTTTTTAAAIAAYTTGGGALFQSALVIKNMTLTATGGGDCLDVSCGNVAIGSGITFGAVTGGGGHTRVDGNQSRLFCQANYTITGGASWHLASVGLGLLDYNNGSITVTLSGTPAFTTTFALATIMSCIVSLVTWSGAATTPNNVRYHVSNNSVIYTNGAAQSYFPGTGSGSPQGVSDTGGQYV